MKTTGVRVEGFLGVLQVVRKRTLSALVVILPLCVIVVLLQAVHFTDRVMVPAFALASPESPERFYAADRSAEKLGAAGQSSSFGALVNADGTAILPEKTILRLHGSNTIGAKLAPALVSGYLSTILGAEKVEQFAGNMANEVVIKAKFKDSIKVVEIHAHGSATGFKDLATEQCEIGMASRRIQEKEFIELIKLGEMTSPANEHVIALDGIAVVVNKSNKINTLSIKQLADIFSGKTTNWRQVGGEPGKIAVYARDENSGTYDTFKAIVLGQMKLKQGVRRFESNPELSAQVAQDPLGIGFTSLPSINEAKAIAVAETGANPISPSFLTVATEDYPIVRRLYLYTETHPKNSYVRDFIEFVQSQKGQEITNNIDFIGMNIKTLYSEKIDQTQIKSTVMVQEYLKATADAERLSLNFRFQTGKVALDTRAERDLSRVADFLQDRRDRQIILAGFADKAGDYEMNLRLARIRAEIVAEQLRSRGVAVDHVASGGAELPVASNLSLSGKEKNRRVEVWLR
ncbi:MAG: phosphate ABC transporter substrate-binding/OmpA family protein [Desulforhopalus sp.]|nr:phosphate ABC transporter substrate-binding/OmpA family protein [Desulforhopalus sp.]